MTGSSAAGWPLRRGSPAAVGFDPGLTGALDRVLTEAVQPEVAAGRPLVAGAVCAVARAGLLVHESPHGCAQTHEGGELLTAPRAVARATPFDVASVTKLVATTAAAIALVDRGDLRLADDLATLLPALADGAHDPRFGEITVAALLAHRAGLAPWEPTYLHADDAHGALARVAQLPLASPPGQQRRYSDLSMMLLGAVVSAVTGAPLDTAVQRLVLEPLQLEATGYGPVGRTAAATSWGNPNERRMIATGEPYPVSGDPEDFTAWRRHTLVGEVNDGNAHHAFAGVAGHAGLFATAVDLADAGQALLDGLQGRDTPLATATGVRRFLAPRDGPVLGAWGDRLQPVLGPGSGGLGHAGFTGCELLIDPDRDLVIVLVTNRQHPDEPYPALAPLWYRVVRTVLDALR